MHEIRLDHKRHHRKLKFLRLGYESGAVFHKAMYALVYSWIGPIQALLRRAVFANCHLKSATLTVNIVEPLA